MQTAIITGANGQDGFYLQDLLKRENVDPVLVSRASGIDLSDPVVVGDLVANTRPDYIFHLAAKSTIDHLAAWENHNIIACGTLSILEAVRKWAPACKVFLVGSAYQFINPEIPIKESFPRHARNVYCAAREYSYVLAEAYRDMGLQVYWGYLFHHDSPRRGPNHLSQKIAFAARTKSKIKIGDPSVVKEWTHAADTVEAMWALVNQDNIWEANIGRGIGYSIENFAEECFASVKLDYRDFVSKTRGYVAPYKRLICDPSRIYSIGWKPRHGLEYLAEQMVNV